MKLGSLKFNKQALLQAPPEEVALFLALAHSTNEVNALLRMVLWSTDYSSPNNTIVHGQVTLSYIVLRLLAGKLHEAHEVIRKGYFRARVSKSYESRLRPEGKDALRTLKQYFNSTNLIREIRNKFSFHYDMAELSRALPLVDEELVAYLQEGGSANNLYYLAEVIASTAAVTATSAMDISEALHSFTEDLLRVTRAFNTAADAIIAEFISRQPDVSEGRVVEVRVPDLELTLQVRLPWFTDSSDIAGSTS